MLIWDCRNATFCAGRFRVKAASEAAGFRLISKATSQGRVFGTIGILQAKKKEFSHILSTNLRITTRLSTNLRITTRLSTNLRLLLDYLQT